MIYCKLNANRFCFVNLIVSHSATSLDIFKIGVKCAKNDQKMIREQFEAFPALLQ